MDPSPIRDALAGVDDPALVDAVAAWHAADPDPDTRAEVERLVADGDLTGLRDRFGSRLSFGTAGLRGALGAGPNRMNRLVVRQAAAGLVAHVGPGARVVVGYDARHRSDDFALDTARVVAAAGGTALVLPRPLPTPVVAFAVRQLGADAGVMVTASHNPPADNGYKVYLGDGAQIVPPADAEISARILAAAEGPIALAAEDDPAIVHLGDEVLDAYLVMAAACATPGGPRRADLVYTAMHGVGRDVVHAALRRAGFAHPHDVVAQAEPDPDFSTVAFPNPEEPGALDLSLALAVEVGADAVLANDPDADRLGVAVPDAAAPGGWRALTGNEIGALLADHLLARSTGADRLVVTTIVSSRLLQAQAAAAGVRYAETLTGFKWIVRPGLADPSARFLFGYEEALGYAVSADVRDKDGVTAAVVFAELVAGLRAEGRTVIDRLDDLARRHGLHATDTWSIRFDQVSVACRPPTPGRSASTAPGPTSGWPP
ncbi:MAG TPA: phospho-sugar mutase [Acidimicrobiales bacterium]|nr:phospho-sugar mutase [Acidimicrobiales bacterium]